MSSSDTRKTDSPCNGCPPARAQPVRSCRTRTSSSVWISTSPSVAHRRRRDRQLPRHDPVGQPEPDRHGAQIPSADGAGRAERHDLLPEEHGHPVRQRLHFVHVVRRQQHRRPRSRQQLDQLPRVTSTRWVQPRRRLVEEQELRVADDAQSDVETALLATRQVLDAVVRLLGQPDELNDLARPVAGSGSSPRCASTPGAPSSTAPRRVPGARRRSACAASAACCGRPGRRPASRPARRCASRNPSRISTVVVLPAPFGPSSANTSPFCTSKLTSRTATVSP